NLGNFSIVYPGTASNDDYLVRLSAAVSNGIAYSDDFNRASLNVGAYSYTITKTAGDGGASIASNILTLTNDATGTGNAAGAVYASTPLSAFTGFNPQLNLNSSVLTWSFNVRQIRPNPSGFGNANYGAAFILAAT